METSDIAGRGTSDHCLRVGRGHATYAAKQSTDVEHRVLSLKPHFRPEWRGQDGQDETQKPYHSASLGDSVTSSTRIEFSVHTGTATSKQKDRPKAVPVLASLLTERKIFPQFEGA